MISETPEVKVAAVRGPNVKKRLVYVLKSLAAKCFKFVVCNPCQSSPSLTMFVPLWFIIISLLCLYLSKLLFFGFLPNKGNFTRDQNNSKYCD